MYLRCVCILFFIGFKLASSQSRYNLAKVDSLHKFVLTKKELSPNNKAEIHYTIGELFRYSNINDSAYYYYNKSKKFYKNTTYKFNYAKVLYGLAVVQSQEKDYTGSEAVAYKAISVLDNLPNTNDVNKYKSYLYNVLGFVFKELDQYKQSVKYFKQSIKIKKSLKGDTKSSINNSINNLAFTYSSFGDYKLALKYYKLLLKDKDIEKENPSFYALVLANYANNLFLLKRFKKLPNLYFKALRIANRDEIDSYESIIIYQYLSKFHFYLKQYKDAKYFAHKAKSVAESFGYTDYLESLLILSRIEEPKIALNYLRDYVKLSDSLYAKERKVRNKFERIKFETNKIEQENIQITQQRLWLLIISVLVILASFIIYTVVNKRHKAKELRFVQQQQQANQDIYNLMLAQSNITQEARYLEKKRISQELHDGVLGRLFGTRLSLDSLNTGVTDYAVSTRGQYIEALKDIEDDIRKVSHELNTDFVSHSGFMAIIKTLIETQCLSYKLEWQLKKESDINWNLVSNVNKMHIYRILQEALHNIHKHAHAKKVYVAFSFKNDLLHFDIQDNGIGFNLKKANLGIGLKNIKSRVIELKGAIDFSSNKNKGTQINIVIPVV